MNTISKISYSNNNNNMRFGNLYADVHAAKILGMNLDTYQALKKADAVKEGYMRLHAQKMEPIKLISFSEIVTNIKSFAKNIFKSKN